MSRLANNVNAAVFAVGKTLKTSSGSTLNILICLLTIGSEQLFSFASFTCPCPNHDDQLSQDNGIENMEQQEETARFRFAYGMVYTMVPAVILFILGCAMNMKTWKMMTGCRKRHYEVARGYKTGCATLMEIVMQALVAPSTWVAIALLDGKYYACAMTFYPYDMTCSKVFRTSARKMKFSLEYEINKQKSQILGWIFIAVILFLASIIYMAYRWCSDLTYHHRLYMKWYRNIEKQEFEELAKKELSKKAKKNITNFFSLKRNKEDWDGISTVFDFKRNTCGYALYSRLDEWNDDNFPPSDDENLPSPANSSSDINGKSSNNKQGHFASTDEAISHDKDSANHSTVSQARSTGTSKEFNLSSNEITQSKANQENYETPINNQSTSTPRSPLLSE